MNEIKSFLLKHKSWTHKMLAKEIGRSESQIGRLITTRPYGSKITADVRLRVELLEDTLKVEKEAKKIKHN